MPAKRVASLTSDANPYSSSGLIYLQVPSHPSTSWQDGRVTSFLGVPLVSSALPLFLSLIISPDSRTTCKLHSYTNDCTLHHSASFIRRSSQQEIKNSRLDATERLHFNSATVPEWARRKLMSSYP